MATSKNLLQTVFDALMEELSEEHYADAIQNQSFDNDVLKKIIQHINNKKLRYPSDFFRYLSRNKNVLTELLQKKISNVEKCDNEKILIKLIKDKDLKLENLSSIRSNAILEETCKRLNKKPSLKNKLNMHYYLRKYINQSKEVNKLFLTHENMIIIPELTSSIIDDNADKRIAINKSSDELLTYFSTDDKIVNTDIETTNTNTNIANTQNSEHPSPGAKPYDNGPDDCNIDFDYIDFDFLNPLQDTNTNIANTQIFEHPIPGSKPYDNSHDDNIFFDNIDFDFLNPPKDFNGSTIIVSDDINDITPGKIEFISVLPTPDKIEMPDTLLNLSDNEVTQILPLNSKNVDMLPESKFSDCVIEEGFCEISERYYNLILKEEKLDTFYYPSILRNRIKHFINNTCIIYFKDKSYLRNGSIKLYAKCKHDTCKKFVIILKNRSVTVFSSSPNFCHKDKLTSYVKGADRLLVQQELLEKMPSRYKKESILQVKKNLLHYAKNLQNIKSDPTVNKIRSEAMAHLDRDRDDLIDLIKMQRDHPEYIREISFPFAIKTFSIEQFFLIESQNVGGVLPVLYFDATGNVLRKPFDNCKRIYLYSGVISLLKTKRIVSVFELISSQHFSKDIFKMLIDFKLFCEERGKWPVFSSVVSDFSFANIHALTRAFNGMDLKEYLKISFEIACGKTKLPNKLITIHLCCSHFMKMFSKDIDQEYSDKSVACTIKSLLASCVKMTNINVITDWFLNAATLFSSPYFDKNVKSAYELLLSTAIYPNPEIEEENLNSSIIFQNTEFNNVDQKILYKSSPFYHYFTEILGNVVISENGPKNPYFNKTFFDLLLTKYIPYIALWSGLVIEKGTWIKQIKQLLRRMLF